MKRYFKVSFIGILVISLLNSAKDCSVRDDLSNEACPVRCETFHGARVVRQGTYIDFDKVEVSFNKIIETKDVTVEKIYDELAPLKDLLNDDILDIFYVELHEVLRPLERMARDTISNFRIILSSYSGEVSISQIDPGVLTLFEGYIDEIRDILEPTKQDILVGLNDFLARFAPEFKTEEIEKVVVGYIDTMIRDINNALDEMEIMLGISD